MSTNHLELLFPPQTISALEKIRGPIWQNLISSICATGSDPVDQTAFVLMIARLANCLTCNASSFRSTQGCMHCTNQAIRRFREPDENLIDLFNQARSEIKEYTTHRNEV
jgi:hypothetical protein